MPNIKVSNVVKPKLISESRALQREYKLARKNIKIHQLKQLLKIRYQITDVLEPERNKNLFKKNR